MSIYEKRLRLESLMERAVNSGRLTADEVVAVTGRPYSEKAETAFLMMVALGEIRRVARKP